MISNSTTVFSPVPAQMTRYTGPTTQDLAHIPAVLTTLPQWVLWRGEDRVDAKTGEIKLNKIPINPHTLHNADTTDITTWGSCAQAVAALPVALEEWEQDDPSAYRGGGIGFVFTADDPVAGDRPGPRGGPGDWPHRALGTAPYAGPGQLYRSEPERHRPAYPGRGRLAAHGPEKRPGRDVHLRQVLYDDRLAPARHPAHNCLTPRGPGGSPRAGLWPASAPPGRRRGGVLLPHL